jgi:hypothetical protein
MDQPLPLMLNNRPSGESVPAARKPMSSVAEGLGHVAET